MDSIQEIHQKALEAAARFKRAEADLIVVLQELDRTRVFFKLGYTSLFAYTVRALGLSESVAANFVTVARKAREVPVLHEAIRAGALTVSKARKITPVLTLENQEEWIEKAKSLPTRKLEEEVARLVPRGAGPERLKVVSEERRELRMGISRALEEKLKKVQDLEAQRTSRAVSLEETLEAALDLYLEAKNPLRRAERVLGRRGERVSPKKADDAPASVTGHVGAVPAFIRHQVILRDRGRCRHIDSQGVRCESRRWIDIHHVMPRSEGGENTVENLITLCSAHHRMVHAGTEHERMDGA